MSPSANSARCKQLQGFAEREEIVDLELQRVGEMGQVGLAVVGRGGDFLEHAGERVGRDQRQRQAEAGAGRGSFAAGGLGLGALGHQRVDLVDQLAKFGVEAVARLGKRNGDLGRDPAGVRGEDEDAVAHQHRLFDVVGDHQDRLDRDAPLLPQVEQVGAQRLGGQHVERGERLVHQQDLRLHDQRAGEADALAHAAGKLLRIGGFEAVEADDVDRLQRALARLVVRHALRPQARSRRCRARVSQGNSAKLWNTIATPSAGPSTGAPPMADGALGRPRQPGDDAQQRRLAAARTAEQRDDLARLQAQRNVLQHRRAGLAGALRIGLADAADVEQHGGGGVQHERVSGQVGVHRRSRRSA